MIYEIVRRQRPIVSMWWSGVAAGLSISFSLLAIVQMHLPDAPWRSLVSSFGYSVGFIMVSLGRQQLFTENTITVVLPVMPDFSLTKLGKLGRMWSVVFVANMAGTLIAALFCTYTPVLTPELRLARLDISHHAVESCAFELLFRGIMIVAMVWLIPGADTARSTWSH